MKLRLPTVVLVCTLLLVSTALIGCASEAAAPEDGEITPQVQDGEEQEPPTAAKVETIVLKGQQHNLTGNPFYENFAAMCADITTASQGRIEMKPFPGGSIVPSTEEFDAVDKGILDFALNNSFYWMNHFPAAGLFAYRAGGMAPMEFLTWLNTGGGAELMQEMVQGYNVHVICGGGNLCTPEIFLSTDKELSTAADFKGLKVRAGGDGAEVLAKLGASVVMFPSDEIYEAMQRGVIDAFECSNPTVNWSVGMHEVAKYHYLSGSRQPMEYLPFFFNKDVWDSLTPELQKLIEEITRSGAIRIYTELVKSDAEHIQMMIDYGNEVPFLSPEIEDSISEAAAEVYADKTATDAFYKKVYDSQVLFQKQIRQSFNRL
ncbi:MAG: TRAP transporter substrate-binding protein DctP [Candidatus Thorarchaeota archaeon]